MQIFDELLGLPDCYLLLMSTVFVKTIRTGLILEARSLVGGLTDNCPAFKSQLERRQTDLQIAKARMP